MLNNVFPTKGNLLNTKKSLALARMGYELMDRKRNILVREMMQLIDKSSLVRKQIASTYTEAFAALQRANISSGVIEDIAEGIPVETGLSIKYRSVMGVEIPRVEIEEKALSPNYGFHNSNSQLDIAFLKFNKAKELTVVLAEVENSVYRLARAIQKTQKRANALTNIIIPNFEETVKFITDALEEKEREEFSRLKVVKNRKNNIQPGI